MPTSGRLCPISSRPCVLSYSPPAVRPRRIWTGTPRRRRFGERSSRQYAPIPASAPCDKAHHLQKGAIQQWNCSFFLIVLCFPESAPIQPRRRAYRWRKSCSIRSKGSCVQSGVRCRGGAFVGITSPVKCKNSADSMALSISVTVCHCAGVG